jgi:hypothetical protein
VGVRSDIDMIEPINNEWDTFSRLLPRGRDALLPECSSRMGVEK